MSQPKQITHAESWTQVEYATTCPFSAQNKWLLLQDGRGFYSLYTGEGEFDRLTHIGHNLEPRWDSNDPNTFYYVSGNTIRRYDAMTHESSIVQIFTEYVVYDPVQRNGVQGLGEGDIENNVWALAGMLPNGKRHVFVYDLSLARKGKILELEPDDTPLTFNHSGRAHGLDNLYATPSGNCQIGWYATGKDRFQGVELYDKDMNFLRQLAPVMSHNDVASYQGRDVLIWGSSADAEINKNALFAIDNQTGEKRMLLDLDWKYAYHVTAGRRWFVSTYAPDNSLPSQILELKPDGGADVIAETKAVMMKNEQGGMAYNPTPRASVSRDGSRVVFNSNFGQTDRGVNYVDVALVKLVETEKPAPPPPPPIVVQPVPDRSEIDALHQALAVMATQQGTLERQLAEVTDDMRTAQTELTGAVAERDWEQARANRLDHQLFVMAEHLQAKQHEAARLVKELTDIREQWKKTQFIPEEVGRRWQFRVRPDRLLDMADVLNGDMLAPVTTWKEGNEYKFKAVRAPNGDQAFEFFERITNQ